MKQTAHLVVKLEMRKGMLAPAFKHVGIYSSGPEGLTALPNTIFAQILQVSGKTYQKAHDHMMEVIRMQEGLHWVLPFVEETREAHMKSFDLMDDIKARAESWFAHDNKTTGGVSHVSTIGDSASDCTFELLQDKGAQDEWDALSIEEQCKETEELPPRRSVAMRHPSGRCFPGHPRARLLQRHR